MNAVTTEMYLFQLQIQWNKYRLAQDQLAPDAPAEMHFGASAS